MTTTRPEDEDREQFEKEPEAPAAEVDEWRVHEIRDEVWVWEGDEV